MRYALFLAALMAASGCTSCEETTEPAAPAASEPGTPAPTRSHAAAPAAAPTAEQEAPMQLAEPQHPKDPASVARSSVAPHAPVMPGSANAAEFKVVGNRLTKMQRITRVEPAPGEQPAELPLAPPPGAGDGK